MKALLVVEDKPVLNKLKQILNDEGFDTICYQWIIKALDNVEEISPHIVIISAKDYPRHWKTLVQYIQSNLLDTEPTIILLSNELSKDESEKVAFLGIKTVIHDIDLEKSKLLDALKPFIPAKIVSEPITKVETTITQQPINESFNEHKNNDQVELKTISEPKPFIQAELKPFSEVNPFPEQKNEPIIEQKTQANTEPTSTFTITHPVTHEQISGIVKSYQYPVLTFIPDDKNKLSVLRFGQLFSDCKLQETDENGNVKVSTHRAQIRGTGEIIKFCLLK